MNPITVVIAIDGPSGSGKSTLGKALAKRLGYQYIDSGAVYRAIAKKAIDRGVSLNDHESLAAIASSANVRIAGEADRVRVLLEERDVTEELRLPEVSNASSVVATVPELRKAVVAKLREMSRGAGVVMDGRDIGTKVFPDATLKLFLDATIDERADRRFKEERQRGRDVSLEQVRAEIVERDRRDTERAATPLVKAADAIVIDSSHLSVEAVIERVLEIIKSGR